MADKLIDEVSAAPGRVTETPVAMTGREFGTGCPEAAAPRRRTLAFAVSEAL